MITPIICLALAGVTFGAPGSRLQAQVRPEDVRESCKAPFITKNFDPTWEDRHGFFYFNTTLYPIVSNKAEFVKFAQQLYKAEEFDDLRETHLVNPCLNITRNEAKVVGHITGWNGLLYVKNITPIPGQALSWTFPPAFPGNPGGHMYISLTDNKSFIVIVLCFDDNVGTFTAVSPYKSLPPDAIYLIKEHAKSLGFKEEYFIEPNNEECEGPLLDVPVPKGAAQRQKPNRIGSCRTQY